MSGLDSSSRDRDDDSHVAWDECAVGWAVRALEPDDEDRFAEHLGGCERCQATVGESGRILAEVLAQLPLQSPRPELRARLLAEVANTRQPIPASRTTSRPAAAPLKAEGELIDFAAARHRSVARRTRVAWTTTRTLIAAAAAVLVIAGLGIWNVTLQADRDRASAVAADRGEILQDLAAAGEQQITPLLDGEGQPVATLVLTSSTARVLTDGLDVNNDLETTYVLWGLQEVGQQPVPLGTFDVVDSELDLRTVGSTVSGIDSFKGYAVTLESGRTAPTEPTLPMVASGQVSS